MVVSQQMKHRNAPDEGLAPMGESSKASKFLSAVFLSVERAERGDSRIRVVEPGIRLFSSCCPVGVVGVAGDFREASARRVTKEVVMVPGRCNDLCSSSLPTEGGSLLFICKIRLGCGCIADVRRGCRAGMNEKKWCQRPNTVIRGNCFDNDGEYRAQTSNDERVSERRGRST